MGTFISQMPSWRSGAPFNLFHDSVGASPVRSDNAFRTTRSAITKEGFPRPQYRQRRTSDLPKAPSSNLGGDQIVSISCSRAVAVLTVDPLSKDPFPSPPSITPGVGREIASGVGRGIGGGKGDLLDATPIFHDFAASSFPASETWSEGMQRPWLAGVHDKLKGMLPEAGMTTDSM